MSDWSDDPVAVETRITVHEAVCAERYASILAMLRDTAKDFVAEHAPVKHMRALRDANDQTGFSRALWKSFAEMGFTGFVLFVIFHGFCPARLWRLAREREPTADPWLSYLAKAVVLFPGGFGTLDELFEILTLVQTRKMRKRMPIVLFGAKFWDQVLNFDALVRYGTISPEDAHLFHRTDSIDEAYELITRGLTEHALGSPGPVL